MQLKETLEIIDAEWDELVVSVSHMPTTEPDFKWEWCNEYDSHLKTVFKRIMPIYD